MLKTWCIKYKYQLINVLGHAMFLIWGILIPGYWIIGLVLGWIFSNLFHYLYIHRIYTHQQHQVSETVHTVGLFGFSLMNLGSPAVYAGVHLNHHTKSGTANDPHNPYALGFVRTLCSIWNDQFTPNRKVLAKSLKNKKSRWFHDNHLVLSLVSAIMLPFITVAGFWLSKIVIVVVHIKGLGTGIHKKDDTSQNVWWLKPITWGEEMHNNHHIRPGQANHKFTDSLKEFDGLYYIGKCLEKIS